MAAKAIVREQSLFEHIGSMNEHAEEQAAAGEWEAVARLLGKRDAMLREIGDDEKEDALLISVRSTARIRAMVIEAKGKVGEELGRLQRGREATASYGANS